VLAHHSQKKRRRDMLTFIIGLVCGAAIGFMGAAILAAGRIQDAERAAALAEWKAER